jgi:predicted DNA-binding transcriptional regulator AlpA
MTTLEPVNSLAETANRLGIHARTLQRMLAEGTGPATVRLSPRRVGILESDLVGWIAARRRPLAGERADRRRRASDTLNATR